VGCGLSKRWNWRHAILSRPSNSELAYLDGILASTIVVIIEGEINCRFPTGDNLPDEGEVIVVGIRYFYLFRGIGRVTGRERLLGCRVGLEIDGYASSPVRSPEKG
jgi:hypothetical protein